MKERPILFSAPMVRAILEGRKTQTRRVVKLPPGYDIQDREDGTLWPWIYDEKRDDSVWLNCPRGQPGDRLWVREEFSGPHGLTGVLPREWQGVPIWYWADGEPLHGDWTKPKPSIHMPRWASRINLEIAGVRVEQLQDISEADAIAEGVEWDKCPATQNDVSLTAQIAASRIGMAAPYVAKIDYIGGYRRLWESINGPGSWDKNPWVWVVEFKK